MEDRALGEKDEREEMEKIITELPSILQALEQELEQAAQKTDNEKNAKRE